LLFIFLFFCLHNQKKPVHLPQTLKDITIIDFIYLIRHDFYRKKIFGLF
jgi:hypothetical protein